MPSPHTCIRCAACCRWPGHVLLTQEDIVALASYLGLSQEELIQRYTVLASNRAQLSLAEREDGVCVFLDGNECRVYDARPAQCRDFPSKWSVSGCPARSREFAVQSLLWRRIGGGTANLR